MTRLQRILFGVVVLATVAGVAMCVRRGTDSRKSVAKREDRSGQEREQLEQHEPEPDDPSDPDEPEAFDGSRSGAGFVPNGGAGSAAPGSTSTSVARTPATGASPRVERLHANVLREAVRANWVSIDDSGTPCPPDRVRIVYTPPSNLGQYKKGAYFKPLGPAPGESTDEVNGLLVCDGYTFLYRGFEAYFRADSGRWDIFPFPVIED